MQVPSQRASDYWRIHSNASGSAVSAIWECSMKKISFRVDGHPVPWRVTSRAPSNKKATLKNWQDIIQKEFLFFRQLHGIPDHWPTSDSIFMTEHFFDQTGVDVTIQELKNLRICDLRGDVDNLSKAVNDALESLVWKNDRQIWRLSTEKGLIHG